MPALIAQQRHRGQEVEARQGKERPQQETHLGYTQTQGGRGWEQRRWNGCSCVAPTSGLIKARSEIDGAGLHYTPSTEPRSVCRTLTRIDDTSADSPRVGRVEARAVIRRYASQP